MTTLVTALYAEGRSDEHFLPFIIQRTAAQILSRQGRWVVDVLEPMRVAPLRKVSRAEDILAVARQVHGYHILFIHADADATTSEFALQQRINPGAMLVQQAQQRGEPVCPDFVPIIPVQMTEAWMLADTEALLDVIGVHPSAAHLGLPRYAHQIEAMADPKQLLTQAFQTALAARPLRQRRRRELQEIFEPLAQQINLTRLKEASSYRQFVDDLTKVLSRLNFIQAS